MKTPTKPIAGRSAVAADRETPQESEQQRKHSRRSTSTAAQRERLIEVLRERPHTTDELRRLGIFSPGPRVFDLRAEGFEVFTELVDELDVFGYPHRKMARYVLLAEPHGCAG